MLETRVPRSLTDLAGLNVGAEEFLAAVLEPGAEPIWVVDPDGMIRFANPAALAALGYDSADELLGRHIHETIHYRRPDGTPYPANECPMLLPRMTSEKVARELDWFLRRDGSMFPVSYVSVPLDMAEGRGAVVAFTDIEDRMRAERELRERTEFVAAEQAAQRRVDALVARGVPAEELFDGGVRGQPAPRHRRHAHRPLRARRHGDGHRRVEPRGRSRPHRHAPSDRR